MSNYSNFNIVYRLQKWIDTVPGQTFLNYGYSWGAAVVILGALFKLTHLPGANIMLFVGMGTEVVVFFLSAFDRPSIRQMMARKYRLIIVLMARKTKMTELSILMLVKQRLPYKLSMRYVKICLQQIRLLPLLLTSKAR